MQLHPLFPKILNYTSHSVGNGYLPPIRAFESIFRASVILDTGTYQKRDNRGMCNCKHDARVPSNNGGRASRTFTTDARDRLRAAKAVCHARCRCLGTCVRDRSVGRNDSCCLQRCKSNSRTPSQLCHWQCERSGRVDVGEMTGEAGGSCARRSFSFVCGGVAAAGIFKRVCGLYKLLV